MKLIAKPNAHSRDMVDLCDAQGECFAASHIDLFWEKGPLPADHPYSRLRLGKIVEFELVDVNVKACA